MFVRCWVFAGAAAAALMSGALHAQASHTLEEDAAAFGARPSVMAPVMSPDGSALLYLTPGKGPVTYAVVSDLNSGKTSVMTLADGVPETVRWCNYSARDRAV